MGKSDHSKLDLVAIARDVAIREGFVVDFPKGTSTVDPPATHPTVVDERHLLWSSVDNRESTDLDQIEVAERLPDGVIRVKTSRA